MIDLEMTHETPNRTEVMRDIEHPRKVAGALAAQALAEFELDDGDNIVRGLE